MLCCAPRKKVKSNFKKIFFALCVYSLFSPFYKIKRGENEACFSLLCSIFPLTDSPTFTIHIFFFPFFFFFGLVFFFCSLLSA